MTRNWRLTQKEKHPIDRRINDKKKVMPSKR